MLSPNRKRSSCTRTAPSRGTWRLAVALVPVMVWTGCASSHSGLFNSWLEPAAVGNFSGEATLEIRTSLSIQDSAWGVPGATDPVPADLIPHGREYRFARGDTMNVRIWELFLRDTETAVQPTVDDVGNIRIPFLGTVNVDGMTPRELEQELVDLLAQKQLIVDNAQVIVEPLVRRNSTYVVFGATTGPNIYPLPSPEFSLLEALTISGGLSDQVLDIYIFREGEAPPVEQEPTEASPELPDPSDVHLAGGYGSASQEAVGWYGNERAVQQPPDEPEPGAASQPSDEEPSATSQPQEEPPPPDESAVRELIESVAPSQPGTDTAGQPDSEAKEPGAAQSRWIFLNGKWIEVTPETPEEAEESRAEQDRRAAQNLIESFPEFPEPTVDWAAVAGEKQHRVIHISAEALRNGDPRQNIIVRPGDTIRLMAGDVGEYYLMGQVNRPGSYSLTGRRMTLKTAIAGAGNLAPLAWPDRCTVYRRLGDREEMIQVNINRLFAGDDPDFYIKKDDLIVVGTHPASVFLAILRNAFRITYGFGFVWDRNFADVDNLERNLKVTNRVQREIQNSNRFPGLFP